MDGELKPHGGFGGKLVEKSRNRTNPIPDVTELDVGRVTSSGNSIDRHSGHRRELAADTFTARFKTPDRVQVCFPEKPAIHTGSAASRRPLHGPNDEM